MGRPLQAVLWLLLLQAASIYGDRCEEISSSVVFNQIAISSMLRDRNVCAVDVAEKTREIVEKVEATEQGLREILTTMEANLNRDLKTWVTEALSSHTKELKTWVSETVQNITKDLTVYKAELEELVNMTVRFLQPEVNTLASSTEVKTRDPLSNKVKDCLSHKLLGGTETSTYVIYPFDCLKGVQVRCDMTNDDGGWTVMVKRQEQTPQVNFRVGWQDYKTGFGNTTTEYWLGNDVIHALTVGAKSEVRMDGEAFKTGGGQRYGYWNDFYIEDELNKYKLHIESIRDADSTMGDALYRSNGNAFTTIDVDNDSRDTANCAADFGGGGWWYDSCSNAFPTGPITHTDNWDDSLNMYRWDPSVSYGYFSLRWVEIKFRNSVKQIRYCEA
ncbi:techylectin-5B-like isoform X1 [Panulirus ornatus]|uniref:techylectin-5B-like isoform X1 n=1 Tax=Panulirus ornatus TaxID=150431 RepID=UPI003A8A878B